MSGQSSGQTPRTSSSSRLSASSSKDKATPLSSAQATSSSVADQNSLENDLVAAEGNPVTASTGNEQLQRRHKPRNSGGFLLPPDSHQARLAPSVAAEISENAKGKRKAEEGDLFVPKRASAHQRHKQKPSLGSSPLATEVSNAQYSEQRGGVKSSSVGTFRSRAIPSTRSSLNGSEIPATSAFTTDGTLPNRSVSAVVQDTDPAQIVNLALSLSESRRRNFSSGGLLPPQDSLANRRLVSSGPSPLRFPSSTAGGSLRQHLNQQRQISRNISPRSARSASGRGASPRVSQQEEGGPRRSSALPDFDAGSNEGVSYNVSDATLARAEKARVALELGYEYRRLLRWLPKLPAPSSDRPSTSKGATKTHVTPVRGLGRAYNPLQYVRNRKVRFSEKRPLDSEAQGWIDVENVRTWVNEVANEREDGLSRVDQPFPLPPFSPLERGLAITEGTQSTGLPQAPTSQSRKIPRPHTVWEFSPWDLLGDAYWLHQDDNLMHIEDSRGKKLMINSRKQQEDRSRNSIDSIRGPLRHSGSAVRLNGSPEKLRASFESLRSDSKERGRRRREPHKHRSPTSDDDGSQNRRSRWPKRFVRSRSSSSSGVESLRDKRRKHVRGPSHLSSRDDYDSAALEKHMMEMLAKESEGSDGGVEGLVDQVTVQPESAPKAPPTQTTRRRPSALQRFRTDMPTSGKHEAAARASFDEQRFQHQRMSSDDFDSTAPNSPTATGFVPSIAINLSPPASPPTSAVSPKKRLSDRVTPFRRGRSPDASKRTVSEHDFALESGTSTNISRQATNASQIDHTTHKQLPKDPNNGLLSPTKNEAPGKTYRPLGNTPIRGIKDSSMSDSKFRGFFKGGRIAELVGSEVSKVGDLIWRKDSSNSNSQINSPAVSDYPSEESDVDDGDISLLDNSPDDDLSRAVSHGSGKDGLSRTSTKNEKPKYHMSNLPNFRSPFSKDESLPKSSKHTPEHDHITRQQLALRERGRSSRFDRLAPPKIDMRGVSPSPSQRSSPERQRTDSHHDKDSRGSSSSGSGRRVRSADRRLNAMLNVPGRFGSGGPAPTGLSALASRRPDSRKRPTLEEKRQWSISDRGVSAVRGTITKRDIARVRALLLSSGVKANEIARRAEETPSKPSRFLQNLQLLFHGQVPGVPRSQEYIIAGRVLVSSIETTTQHLRDSAEQFSHNTVDDLHGQINGIEDHVNCKLTPLVRAAADDADTFSTELTTTHTLAVKQLNDSVDIILRRRRRRLRWIRRGGWAMLEWTLLGIMWMVWFVVVIVRLVRGSIAGLIRGLRWFFWL